MPRAFLAFVLAALFAPFSGAEPPALVVQSRSTGALIGEAKTLAKLAGDDFDDWLETTFGDDGLKSVDLSKPLIAYAPLTGNAAEAKLFMIVEALKLNAAKVGELARVNPKKLAGWPKADFDELVDLVRDTLDAADKLAPVARLTVGGTGELKIRAALSVPTVRIARKLTEFLDVLLLKYPR